MRPHTNLTPKGRWGKEIPGLFQGNQGAWWFKVTFSSPSWRSLNPLKASLNNPKKVTLNHQVGEILFHLARYYWIFPVADPEAYDRMSRATPFSNLSSERSGLPRPFFP